MVSWPSVEPADDYTANSLLAFALAAGAHDHGYDTTTAASRLSGPAPGPERRWRP